jgi:hypothetical protein
MAPTHPSRTITLGLVAALVVACKSAPIGAPHDEAGTVNAPDGQASPNERDSDCEAPSGTREVIFTGLHKGRATTSRIRTPPGACLPTTQRGSASDGRATGGIARQVFEATGISGCVGMSGHAARELFADVLCAGGRASGPFAELDGPPALPSDQDLTSKTTQELKDEKEALEKEEAELEQERKETLKALAAKKALDDDVAEGKVRAKFGDEPTEVGKALSTDTLVDVIDNINKELTRNDIRQRAIDAALRQREEATTKRPNPDDESHSVVEGCRDQVAKLFDIGRGNVDPSPDDPPVEYVACAASPALLDICYDDWLARPRDDEGGSRCAKAERVPAISVPCRADLAATRPPGGLGGSLCDVKAPDTVSPVFQTVPKDVLRVLAATLRFSGGPPPKPQPRDQ